MGYELQISWRHLLSRKSQKFISLITLISMGGVALGVDYGLTVTCYQADDDGRACGRCEACRLRAAGFAAAGVADPTPYQPPST